MSGTLDNLEPAPPFSLVMAQRQADREAQDRRMAGLMNDMVRAVLRAGDAELPPPVREARARLVLEAARIAQAEAGR